MTLEEPKQAHSKIALVVMVSVGLGLVIGGGLFALALLGGVALSTALTIGIVAALIFMIGMCLWGLFVRSQARKKAIWLGVWQSTTTGTVPDDAQVETWGPRLQNQRRFWKFFRVASPIEFGSFTILGIYLVISEPGVWWAWAELVVFAVAGVFGFVQAGRALTRIDRALSHLDRRRQTAVSSYPIDGAH